MRRKLKMIVNLDYFKERYRDWEVCTETYACSIEDEAAALIRMLLKDAETMQAEIISLRKDTNDLTPGEPVYPNPEEEIPGESYYISELILYLYEDIFPKTADSDGYHFHD
jgi:hypothetical protein